jgi:hypothetical protein
MISIEYSIGDNLELCELEGNPSAMIYICDADSTFYSDVIENQISSMKSTKFDINIENQVSRSLCFCMDLFVTMDNSKSVSCKTRVAGTTINIHDFFSSMDVIDSKFDMINFSTGDVKGSLNLKICGLESIKFKEETKTDISLNNFSKIQCQIDKYISDQINPFIKKRIKPSEPFLYRVHAPTYNTRIMRLPGAAYYILPDRVVTTASEDWCKKFIDITLSRYNMSEETFNQTINSQFSKGNTKLLDHFTTCLSIIGESASVLVHTCTYKSDFTYSAGRKTSIESFDNIFITKAGDCEDSAKGIYTIIAIFSNAKFKSKLMNNVQKVCKLYIPFGVLAEVTNPSINTTSTEEKLAHMFATMIPRSKFYKNSCIDYSKSLGEVEESLPSLLLEGTGRVHCLIDTGKSNNMHCIDGVEQYINISTQTENVFYKKIVHLYSDYALENVLSYSVMNDDNEYGVDFKDFFNDNYKIKNHEELNDNLLEICKKIIHLDTPLLFDKEPSMDSINISSQVTSKRNHDAVYNDVYTNGVNFKDVVQQLDENKVSYNVNLELSDEIDSYYRIRIFDSYIK